MMEYLSSPAAITNAVLAVYFFLMGSIATSLMIISGKIK